MLIPLRDDVWYWQSLNIELKRLLNGYLFNTRVGLVMVDPPPIPSVTVPEIEALGTIRAIIITGKHQERRAAQYQGWYNAKVFAPEGDRRQLRITADHYYTHKETLPGGLVALHLQHQRSPGESVLYHPKMKLLVASHLLGEPAGYVQMQSEAAYWNFSRSFREQLRLLKLDFDCLLPGRGEPITEDARIGLAKFIAGYGLEA